MQPTIIIGNKFTAKMVYEYIRYDRRYTITGFAVDAQFIDEDHLFGLPVFDLRALIEVHPPESCKILMCVGYKNLNRNREGLFHRIKDMGYEVITYIHPDARVYTRDIGEGAIIMPNAFIDVHARIGPNTVLWGNSSVAHHAHIGANCWLAMGCVISGGVDVADNSFVGINATVVNDLRIGKCNIIGAGALIVKNTNDFDVFISPQTPKFRLSAEDYLRFAKI